MSYWETQGKSDEYYTPKYIFDALGCRFDMDVAAPLDRRFVSVPTETFVHRDSLEHEWNGFVWCNPPFGGRNGLIPWVNKMLLHNRGIFLAPDRTSASWWQSLASYAHCTLFVHGKIKFVRPDGSIAKQPSNGTTLFGYGPQAFEAFLNAENKLLGIVKR
jgi:hypothetical protein